VRAFAAVTLSIAIPLTVIGLDEKVLAIGGGVGTAAALILLAFSFKRFRDAVRSLGGLLQGNFRQSLAASSLTVIFGIGVAYAPGPFPKVLFGAAAFVSVNWWFHVLARTRFLSQEKENLVLRQELEKLQNQVTVLAPAGEENDRLRAVVQHVINVLVSLEKAKEGRGGVNELGPAVWIEHRCLRSTRDVLAQAAGLGDYRIELGILRVADEVIHTDMAAGKLLEKYKEQIGCPLGRAPDQEAIEEILRMKEIEGGFADSRAIEFKLHGEPHYMVALCTAEFDEIDGEMLSLIGTMFVVLKLALEA
jgi:hypothetical protein